MAAIDVRKGMPTVQLSREEFGRRYRSRFADPVFEPLRRELDAIVDAAWDGYVNSRKAPLTRKAGSGFADPEYEVSVDWLAAREAILAAQRRHDDAGEMPRILLINGSSRSENFTTVRPGLRPLALQGEPSCSDSKAARAPTRSRARRATCRTPSSDGAL